MEVNVFLAFLFGILSFFSPCVLPLVPGYLTIFSGTDNTIQSRLRAVSYTHLTLPTILRV